MNDYKLVRYLLLILLLPLTLAMCSGDRYRYPCQNPENWDLPICQKPKCDVTRTCPEHVFRGQRDPRLGPPTNEQNQSIISTPTQICNQTAPQGANCARQ
jgi:hypothetical protein